jgi:hypothetical protein
MSRRARTWLPRTLACIGALALVAALAGQAEAAKPKKKKKRTPAVEIVDASHLHPQPNPGYSFVCMKIKGAPGEPVRVIARGGSPEVNEIVRLNNAGRLTWSARITVAGPWTLQVSDALRRADSQTYTVPPPPPDGAERGPFACPPAD